MNNQPIFKDCKFFTTKEEGSVGEDLFNRGVCLPSDTKMSDEDIASVIEIVKSLF